jgi:orotidine-5'-phosphate decarboxylase
MNGMPEVIVALDVPSSAHALRLVDALGETGTFYKVGSELFTREGPGIVRELHERGKRVFLDLKLHDIPNTVSEAVRAASDLGVDLLTLHTLGGRSMLEAAVETAKEAAHAADRPKPLGLLGVTILTSLSASEVEATWGRSILSLRDEVARLAALAESCGVQGVVASVLEVRAIKRELGQEFLVVTPGIRLAGGESHDQARVATPAEAARLGADYLVLGRAVTAAPEPRHAMERVLNELGAPRASRDGGGR